MNLTIHGNHVEVSPALRDHVINKWNRIERILIRDRCHSALTCEKLRQRQRHVRVRAQHSSRRRRRQYAAIDTLVDKLDGGDPSQESLQDHHGDQ